MSEATREEEIREGIARNLKAAITGAQINPWPLANPTPPAIDVIRGDTEYDRAMGRGHDDWEFIVRVFVALGNDLAAQRRLAGLCAQVKEAVEADKTLGGAADTCRVTRQSKDQTYSRDGGGPLLGREFSVFVIAAGD